MAFFSQIRMSIGSIAKRCKTVVVATHIRYAVIAFTLAAVIALTQGCVSNASEGDDSLEYISAHSSDYQSQGIQELNKDLIRKKEEEKLSNDKVSTTDEVPNEIPNGDAKADPVQKKANARGKDYGLDGIEFIGGSARLEPSSDRALNQLLNLLKKYESVHIRLEGYCVRQQTAGANLKVSHQRASAVANYLKINGISANRLRVIGRGASRRISSGVASQSTSQDELIGLIVEKY